MTAVLNSAVLNIVERAYQGTLEEQDDQALWLIHALKNAGTDSIVLLRGPATAYAVAGQTVDQLHIGGVEMGHPPSIDEDLKKMIAKGVPVYAVREDAEERGISTGDMVPEVQLISRGDVARLFIEAKRIFAW